MAISQSQIAFVEDLFSEIGLIGTRKMFGGLGIYHDGTIFAVFLSGGMLCLKGAGPMKQAFDVEGWEPWRYTRKDGSDAQMPYWQVPGDVLEDPDEACAWARRALAAL